MLEVFDVDRVLEKPLHVYIIIVKIGLQRMIILAVNESDQSDVTAFTVHSGTSAGWNFQMLSYERE